LLLIDNSALTVMVSWLFVLSVFLNTVIIGVIVQWLARMLKLVKGKGGSG
jgi:cell division protein FtsX